MNYLRVAIADDAETISLKEVNSEIAGQGGVVQIEDEQISYEIATDRELLRCTRGIYGTSAAAHAADLAITVVDVASSPSALPLLSATEIAALTAPTAGLTVYNTDTNKLNFYNGAAWEVVTSALPE